MDLLEGFESLLLVRVVGRFALERRQGDAYETIQQMCQTHPIPCF